VGDRDGLQPGEVLAAAAWRDGVLHIAALPVPTGQRVVAATQSVDRGQGAPGVALTGNATLRAFGVLGRTGAGPPSGTL